MEGDTYVVQQEFAAGRFPFVALGDTNAAGTLAGGDTDMSMSALTVVVFPELAAIGFAMTIAKTDVRAAVLMRPEDALRIGAAMVEQAKALMAQPETQGV